MCSLAAPRAAAAPSFGATAAFVDRQRVVVAAAAMAPAASSCHDAGEPTTTRRARASEAASGAPARKRGRHDGFVDRVVDDPAAASLALRFRMDAELGALQGLLKRAKLLPARCSASAPTAEKTCAPPVVVSPASAPAAKRTASPSKPATEAAYAPAKQQRPVMPQRAPAKNPVVAPNDVPNSKQQGPAEAPPAAKQQQRPVHRAAAAKTTTEVPKERRPEEEKEKKELARAAARAEFRQMLVEMEKSALPDETIYPEELEALGIPFEFVITRTWKQACLDHAAKKAMEFVVV